MSSHFKDKEELFIIRDSLNEFSEDFHFISKEKPIQIELNGETLFLILNPIIDRGKGRKNPDECRIEIGNALLRKYKKFHSEGGKVVTLGFFPETQTFSAWEPPLIYKRKSPKVFSVYSRFSKLKEAENNNFSVYELKSRILGRSSRCINFRPELLGVYLQNIKKLHVLSEAELDGVFSKLQSEPVASDPAKPGIKMQKVTIGKEQIEVTSFQYPRDSNFRKNVITAYGNACCLCGTQLKVIEAAHIVPHSDPESTDETNNGLALCPSHHKMYDSGLIYFDENFKVCISQLRLAYLDKNDLTKGIEEVENFVGKKINLPKDEDNFPNPELIKKGNKIRLID